MIKQTQTMYLPLVALGATIVAVFASAAHAHHSFAMYDVNKTYVVTGVVTRVDPNPNHLQLFVAPLNAVHDQVIRDDKGEPVIWAVEFPGASVAAREGVTVNNFPRGTVISVGLHPLRNGRPAGGRESSVFKCPPETPPPPGKHCDSVPGATSHGEGVLPEPTNPFPGVDAQ